MKTFLIILTLTAMLACAGSAFALGPVGASARVSLFSKYVWRGLVVTDDPVLQPEIAADFLGFGASIWGNMDLTDYHRTSEDPSGLKGQMNEVDYNLHYGISLPLLKLEAGLIFYDFPNTNESATTEIYLSAAAGVLFSPSVSLYYDMDEIDGGYIQLGASHDVAMSPGSNLNLAASLGYGSKDYVQGYFGPLPVDKALTTLGAGPTNFQLSAALPYHLLPMVTVTPSVTYSTLLGDASDAADLAGNDKNAFFFGVTAGLSF